MKSFLIVLLLTSSILAKDISIRYDVNVGMFGKVGYADFSVVENGDEYEAKLSAIMVGVAATLTGNWVETFTSNGSIVDGKYIPQKFIKTKSTTRKDRIQTYYFDHDKKEVKLVQKKTKTVSNSRFNTADFQIYYEDVNETSHKEEILETYIADDSITAFLNATSNCNENNKLYDLIAIGAHNDENNVTLSFLNGLEKESALLNFSNYIETIYNIHVEPFDKDDEIVDVLVAFDKDGYMQEALLGEVFWIGKITADRVEHNVTKK